ncbi:hypothetical protein Sjap_007019 [Stephania japonica]|uniref:Methyltransferase type 11 domain-containing protein n=1 Tax=Stephania japonica TaxID=461633 RepID=A0AAP0PNE3_9MAGN
MSFNGNHRAYGDPSYWERRYAKDPRPFDWYQSYPSLAPLIRLYVQPNSRVLVVGCGNSVFSEGMVEDGFQDVVNIDISSVAIEAMKKKYSDNAALKYIRMDVRDMSEFESGSFDAVIDKGTLDAIMCGNNSQENSIKMVEEIRRVLKDEGVYILISYGAPAIRLSILMRETCLWTIKLHVIEKFMVDRSPNRQTWELTNPVPLNEDGSSIEATLGKNLDAYYHCIYVCTKLVQPTNLAAE